MGVISDLLMEISQVGIHLRVAGDKLRYSPATSMTPRLAGQLKAHKAAVIATLKREAEPADSYGEREVRRFLRVCFPHPASRGAYDPRHAGIIKSLRHCPPVGGGEAVGDKFIDNVEVGEPTATTFNSERHKQLQADSECWRHWVRHG